MDLQSTASIVGGRVVGDTDREINGVAQVDAVRPDEITFIADEKYLRLLTDKDPAAVLVKDEFADLTCPQIVVADPYLAALQIAQAFFPDPQYEPGIDPAAAVDTAAEVDPTATVMAYAVIGPGATVGPHTVLMPQTYVGAQARVGAHCLLHPGARVGMRCTLGDRVILHHNVSIGADGYGYERMGDTQVKIPQRGIVVIEDDVEIGACSCVDRATFGRTVVGAGAKIDNHVQVAHNCLIGKRCLLVAQTGLAGSVVVGDDCVLAARVGVVPHVRIGAGSILAGGAGATRDVPPGSVVAGIPAKNHMDWKREIVALKNLPQAIKVLQRLVKRVEELETK